MALRNGLENELKTLIEYNEKYQSKHKTLHKNPSFTTQQSSANQNADQLSKKTSSGHPVEAEFPLKIPTGYQPRVESDMSKDYSKESNAKEKKDDIVDRWDIASQSDSVSYEMPGIFTQRSLNHKPYNLNLRSLRQLQGLLGTPITFSGLFPINEWLQLLATFTDKISSPLKTMLLCNVEECFWVL